MHVKAIKQPRQVVFLPADVGKKMQPCPKEVKVVSIPSFTKEVPMVVPV
jgi:hypothetical protein